MMDENPYEPPRTNEEGKRGRNSIRRLLLLYPLWPFYLLLLLIMIAGVLIPVIASMGRK
jgi:hypothetical protein